VTSGDDVRVEDISVFEEDITFFQEYYCGVGQCRLKWMQRFRKGKFFTLFLCLYCCVQGALVSGM